MVTIAFIRKDGSWDNKPKTKEEVRQMYCNQWDSCSPCPFSGGYSRTGGGFECRHPLINSERD